MTAKKKKNKDSSEKQLKSTQERSLFANNDALTSVSVSVVPKRIKKIATVLYLVRAAAASSVFVDNPGETQVKLDCGQARHVIHWIHFSK